MSNNALRAFMAGANALVTLALIVALVVLRV